MPDRSISRNDFLRFGQCKKTWYLKNLENRNKSAGAPGGVHALNLPGQYSQTEVFRRYRTAGEDKFIEYARRLFIPDFISDSEKPGIPDSDFGHIIDRSLSLDDKIRKTKKLVNEITGKTFPVIFSGWFQYKRLVLYVDILELKNDTKDAWNAYAIRSGGGGLNSNSLDMALQYFVLKQNSIEPAAFYAIYVNKRYVFNGTFNPARFFRIHDFLPDLGDQIQAVEKMIDEIHRPITEADIRHIDIGNHCFQPALCKYMNICWSHIPENSVFEIATLDRGVKFELYKKGIVLQKDIKPDSYPDFTPNQKLQIESTINRKTTLNRKEMENFLGRIQYPVYYLDFESFMPIIPLFKNTHPFQHIPFEYCLFKRREIKAAPENNDLDIKDKIKVFLSETPMKTDSGAPDLPPDPLLDPRREFIENLLKDIGIGESDNHGSILVYDSRLEIHQLREIAALYPEFRDSVEAIVARIVDLTYPFQKKFYYTPEMKGLYSIKSLLPALFPEMTYDGLAIKNGYMAMHAFESLFYETSAEAAARIRSDLKEYCKMDVLALVKIHRFLENLISG